MPSVPERAIAGIDPNQHLDVLPLGWDLLSPIEACGAAGPGRCVARHLGIDEIASRLCEHAP
jgi:hypothetical protein